jgi:predicted transcriptional regulator
MSSILSLPPKPQKRSRTIHIRLTPDERAAVERLAERHETLPSRLARHFLMQAVNYYNQQHAEQHDG